MASFVIAEVMLIVGILYGLAWGIQDILDHRAAVKAAAPRDPEGWVYFLSAIGGDEAEPPSPIRLGTSYVDPSKGIPEVINMDLVFSLKTEHPRQIEKMAHAALTRFKLRGEWYERGPTLMFIDYLQGRTP